jgi:hypothetical protein
LLRAAHATRREQQRDAVPPFRARSVEQRAQRVAVRGADAAAEEALVLRHGETMCARRCAGAPLTTPSSSCASMPKRARCGLGRGGRAIPPLPASAIAARRAEGGELAEVLFSSVEEGGCMGV